MKHLFLIVILLGLYGYSYALTATPTRTNTNTPVYTKTSTPTITKTMTNSPTLTPVGTPYVSQLGIEKTNFGTFIQVGVPRYPGTETRYVFSYNGIIQEFSNTQSVSTSSNFNVFNLGQLNNSIPNNVTMTIKNAAVTVVPTAVVTQIIAVPSPDTTPRQYIIFANITPQFTQIPQATVLPWGTPVIAQATVISAMATQAVAQVPSPQFTQIPLATVVPWGTAIIAQATVIAQNANDSKSNTRVVNAWIMNTQGTPTGNNYYGGGQFVISQDYTDSVAEGDIPSHSPYFKDGLNTSIGSTEEFMYANSTAFTWIATPTQLKVVSDSTSDTSNGTGAKAYSLSYLDGNYAAKSITFTAYGTGASFTPPTDIFRVQNFRLYDVGTVGAAAGNIQLLSLDGTKVYSMIGSGLTRARNTAWTVPAGKTFYMTDMYLSSALGTSAATGDYVRMIFRATYDNVRGVTLTAGSFFMPYFDWYVPGQMFQAHFTFPMKFPQYTDMGVWAMSSKGTALGTCRYSGWIE